MKKRVKVDGLRLFYRQEGEGKPLLMLHGWGKSSEDFVALQKLLVRDFTSYALDLPAFGRTVSPPRPWGVKEYAQFVEKFCQAVRLKKFSVLGHSFGGRIAIELAAGYFPKIERLILTGVPILRGRGLKRLSFWVAAKTARSIFFLPPLCFFQKPMRKILYFLAGEHDYYQAKGIRQKILKKVIGYNQKKSLKKIRSPTLIVWGENDQVTPLRHARLLEQKIKNSSLAVISGASHKLPYEKPKEFCRRIAGFLNS